MYGGPLGLKVDVLYGVSRAFSDVGHSFGWSNKPSKEHYDGVSESIICEIQQTYKVVE